MSIATPQAQPASVVAPPPPRRELRIYGHSVLFYWWPVWVLGYILALVTAFHPGRLAIVPEGSEYLEEAEIRNARRPGQPERVSLDGTRNVVAVPQGEAILSGAEVRERVHESKNLGVIFSVVLLLVIVITNVPLRGLSSAITIVLILFFTVLFAYLGWWDRIFELFGRLSIHMNMGFYIFFSTTLLVLWLLVFFGYDRLVYWRVVPGQITLEYVFGGGQKSYDTANMTFEKLRDDLFRHWVLGFGSGDLHMTPLASGNVNREEMHNVLLVGTKLRQIQEMIAEKPD